MGLPRYKGIETIPDIVQWFLKKDDKVRSDLWTVQEIKENLINWTVSLFRDNNQDQAKEIINVLFHEFTYIFLPQLELYSKSTLDSEEQKQFNYLQVRITFMNAQLRISGWIYQQCFGIGFEPYGNPFEILGVFEGFVNYYSILGVSPSATPEEIKKAYRIKAKTHHPDVGGNEEVFMAIKEAYDILMDNNKRREFHQQYEYYQKKHEYDITSNGNTSNKPQNNNKQQSNRRFEIGFNWKAYLRNIGIALIILIIIKAIVQSSDSSNSLSSTSSSVPTTASNTQPLISVPPNDTQINAKKSQETEKVEQRNIPRVNKPEEKNVQKELKPVINSDKPNAEVENKVSDTYGNFTQGATKEEVKELMGTPEQIINIGPISTWYYGRSSVTITNGKVTGWDNSGKNLKLEQPPVNDGTFSTGSTTNDVKSVMGTPEQIINIGPISTWYYGRSSITISNGKVTGWDNSGKNLKLEQPPVNDGTFSTGSTTNDVKSVMGTPEQIINIGPISTWYYGRSSITISNGKVTGWDNSDKNLKLSE